jgi:hypothetical protein
MASLPPTDKVSDHVFRVDDFDVVRQLDITSTNRAFTFLGKLKIDHSRLCNLNTTPFEVQRISTTSS